MDITVYAWVDADAHDVPPIRAGRAAPFRLAMRGPIGWLPLDRHGVVLLGREYEAVMSSVLKG